MQSKVQLQNDLANEDYIIIIIQKTNGVRLFHSLSSRGEGKEGSDLAAVFAAAAATAAGGLALPLSPTPGALLDSKPAFPPFSVKIPYASRFQNIYG